jgi:putative transposase
MKGKKHRPEQIIKKLREADAMLAADKTIGQVCQALEVSEQTYHRWRNQYGGMKAEEAKRLKELEEENKRLKKLLAEAELDKAILKEALRETTEPDAAAGGGPACAGSLSGFATSGLPGPGRSAQHGALRAPRRTTKK